MSLRSKFVAVLVVLAIVGWYVTAGTYFIRAVIRHGNPEIPAGSMASDAGHLDVRILRVWNNCKPLDAHPWHAPGGDWTYFDCAAGPSDNVTFVVGLSQVKTERYPQSAWGEAVLAVADKKAGADFVRLLGDSFHQTPPAERSGRPEGRLKPHMIVSGKTLTRHSGGEFTAKPAGAWTVAEWVLGDEGYEAQVYFNYNLREMKAELREDRAANREDLLVLASAALRDGPLPDRTPANDPGLSLSGPRFTDWRSAATGTIGTSVLAPDNSRVIFARSVGADEWAVASAALEGSGKAADAVRFEHGITRLEPVTADGLRLLADEYIPRQEREAGPEYRSLLWLIDLRTRTKEALVGPWGETSWFLAAHGVSPDGRLVVIGQNLPGPERRDRFPSFGDTVLYIYDITSRKPVKLAVKGQALSFASWKGSGPGLRAVVYTGHPWDKDPSSRRVYSADPATGALDPDPTPLGDLDAAWKKSPDGRLMAELRDDDHLVVTDSATGSDRLFYFHRADRACLDECGIVWASPRYLIFDFSRPTLFDTDKMKISYPMEKDSKIWPVAFTTDFRRVVGRSPDGLFIGRVVMP
jgi:hypothetical protein